MEDFIESVETQEVAEPDYPSSEESQEVAEPEEVEDDFDDTDDEYEEDDYEEPVRTETDAAFANLRRKNEELERYNKRMEQALGLYFEGDDKDIQAIAYAEGKDVEQVRAEFEERQRLETLANENQTLKEQLEEIEVSKMIDDSINQLGKIDPNIKTVEDLVGLGEDFANFIDSGLDPVSAYFATQAKKEAMGYKTPTKMGAVNEQKAEKDFFTSAEVDAMSEEEQIKNFDIIKKSMSKW